MGFVSRIFGRNGSIDYIRGIDEDLHEEIDFFLLLEREYKQKIRVAGKLMEEYNKASLTPLKIALGRVEQLVTKEEIIIRRFKRRVIDQEEKLKGLLNSLPMATVDFSGLRQELDLPQKFKVLEIFLNLEDHNLQMQMGFFKKGDRTLIHPRKLAELLTLIRKEGEVLLSGENSPEYQTLVDLQVLIEDLEPKKGLISWVTYSNLHKQSKGFDHGITSQGT
jgi:hypothetical protein